MSERPLRVGIFVIRFPKLSETFIVTKVLKLLDAGIDVQVFARSEDNDWDAFEILAGREDVRARVHVVPATPWRAVATAGSRVLADAALHHPRALARYIDHTRRTYREGATGFWKTLYQRLNFVGHELDILHIEFDMQAAGIADLKDYLGCHVLLSSRGTLQHTTVLARSPHALDYMFRYVDGYHFISQFLEDNTRALGLPPDVPTWLIPPAVDLSLFTPIPRAPGLARSLRLISAGRLDWAKGYEIALDAVARVRAAGIDVAYTICGDGPYREAIRYAILQLGLADCVTLAGAVARERMPAHYAAADVMIHAAVHEGFCNAVVEAQAMAIPVVTSDAGGLPENVAHGVTGFVVPRRDPAAMAARIIELAHDPALRAQLGQSGRARALARFDLDRQAEAFVALYRDLAARPRRKVQR